MRELRVGLLDEGLSQAFADVEAVAEGDENGLKQLVAWCREGPAMARVEKVNVKLEKYTGEFEHFTIRY